MHGYGTTALILIAIVDGARHTIIAAHWRADTLALLTAIVFGAASLVVTRAHAGVVFAGVQQKIVSIVGAGIVVVTVGLGANAAQLHVAAYVVGIAIADEQAGRKNLNLVRGKGDAHLALLTDAKRKLRRLHHERRRTRLLELQLHILDDLTNVDQGDRASLLFARHQRSEFELRDVDAQPILQGDKRRPIHLAGQQHKSK
jgi:hypothetical protein